MPRFAGMAVVLFGLWLVLSGHTEPLLLAFGVVSTLLTIWVAARLGVIDAEGQPLALLGRLLRYWAWLMGQIVLANLDVARRILAPDLRIEPSVIRVASGKRTDLGRALLANSITLTPGTVSLRVSDDEIEVHALTREAADGLLSGHMQTHAPEYSPGA